jgi:hypothetical protein
MCRFFNSNGADNWTQRLSRAANAVSTNPRLGGSLKTEGYLITLGQ